MNLNLINSSNILVQSSKNFALGGQTLLQKSVLQVLSLISPKHFKENFLDRCPKDGLLSPHVCERVREIMGLDTRHSRPSVISSSATLASHVYAATLQSRKLVLLSSSLQTGKAV